MTPDDTEDTAYTLVIVALVFLFLAGWGFRHFFMAGNHYESGEQADGGR